MHNYLQYNICVRALKCVYLHSKSKLMLYAHRTIHICSNYCISSAKAIQAYCGPT